MTNIAYLLQLRGISVSELARAAGVPQSTLHRIVSGETRTSSVGVGTFIRISRALGMSVEELYFDDPTYDRLKNGIDTVYANTSLAGRQAMLANALGVNRAYGPRDALLLEYAGVEVPDAFIGRG